MVLPERRRENHCGFPDCARERLDQDRATYSARPAITGSTRPALRPGTQLANTAVTPGTTMMAGPDYFAGEGMTPARSYSSLRSVAIGVPETVTATYRPSVDTLSDSSRVEASRAISEGEVPSIGTE